MEITSKVSVSPQDKYYLIGISGEISFKNVVQIRQYILKAIELGYAYIFIDFSGVVGMDSSGIGLLMNSGKKLIDNGGRLVLIAPSKSIFELFEIASVNDFVDIYDSIDEAVKTLR